MNVDQVAERAVREHAYALEQAVSRLTKENRRLREFKAGVRRSLNACDNSGPRMEFEVNNKASMPETMCGPQPGYVEEDPGQ